MAEAIFNKKACETGIDAKASSAGLFADGTPLSISAKEALSNCGISDFRHTSRQLCEDMLGEYDYIIGISSHHASSVAQMYPNYSDKVFAFPTDISDPFGKSFEVYKKTLSEIEHGIDVIISELFGK